MTLKYSISNAGEWSLLTYCMNLISGWKWILLNFSTSSIHVYNQLCTIFLGEEHYNIISALHKSIRGSDENAALYWLARMLEGGETPLYVARRFVRLASEDIGNVND